MRCRTGGLRVDRPPSPQNRDGGVVTKQTWCHNTGGVLLHWRDVTTVTRRGRTRCGGAATTTDGRTHANRPLLHIKSGNSHPASPVPNGEEFPPRHFLSSLLALRSHLNSPRYKERARGNACRPKYHKKGGTRCCRRSTNTLLHRRAQATVDSENTRPGDPLHTTSGLIERMKGEREREKGGRVGGYPEEA